MSEKRKKYFEFYSVQFDLTTYVIPFMNILTMEIYLKLIILVIV